MATDCGPVPTLTVAVTVLVVVLITETVLEAWLATYAYVQIGRAHV